MNNQFYISSCCNKPEEFGLVIDKLIDRAKKDPRYSANGFCGDSYNISICHDVSDAEYIINIYVGHWNPPEVLEYWRKYRDLEEKIGQAKIARVPPTPMDKGRAAQE